MARHQVRDIRPGRRSGIRDDRARLGYVAALVALLVPHAVAARKQLSQGRIIVRTGSPD